MTIVRIGAGKKDSSEDSAAQSEMMSKMFGGADVDVQEAILSTTIFC